MNPDADIEVCAVYPDGTVRIYGQQPKDTTAPRPYIRMEKFPSYGAAKLWADEREAGNRVARAARRK